MQEDSSFDNQVDSSWQSIRDWWGSLRRKWYPDAYSDTVSDPFQSEIADNGTCGDTDDSYLPKILGLIGILVMIGTIGVILYGVYPRSTSLTPSSNIATQSSNDSIRETVNRKYTSTTRITTDDGDTADERTLSRNHSSGSEAQDVGNMSMTVDSLTILEETMKHYVQLIRGERLSEFNYFWDQAGRLVRISEGSTTRNADSEESDTDTMGNTESEEVNREICIRKSTKIAEHNAKLRAGNTSGTDVLFKYNDDSDNPILEYKGDGKDIFLAIGDLTWIKEAFQIRNDDNPNTSDWYQVSEMFHSMEIWLNGRMSSDTGIETSEGNGTTKGNGVIYEDTETKYDNYSDEEGTPVPEEIDDTRRVSNRYDGNNGNDDGNGNGDGNAGAQAISPAFGISQHPFPTLEDIHSMPQEEKDRFLHRASLTTQSRQKLNEMFAEAADNMESSFDQMSSTMMASGIKNSESRHELHFSSSWLDNLYRNYQSRSSITMQSPPLNDIDGNAIDEFGHTLRSISTISSSFNTEPLTPTPRSNQSSEFFKVNVSENTSNDITGNVMTTD